MWQKHKGEPSMLWFDALIRHFEVPMERTWHGMHPFRRVSPNQA